MEKRELADHALRIQTGGYSVVPAVFTPAECAEARQELERILAEERDPTGAELGPAGGWAYSLMNKARIFERTYGVPPLLRLIRHFLGDDCVLSSVQGRVVLPGAPAQSMHYDGSYTGPFLSSAPADEGRRNTACVFGFNVIFCLSPFTRANGATRVVPGSHRLASTHIPDNHPPGEVVVEAEEGSAIVFDIAIWHGASAHTGTDSRYAVMTPWRRSWV
ncbi:MAG TPA: phytanoyl-CoA dioxygenase family protein, partial [Armatimonadota bacterium]|nr:phytanoyl-CoA dioxygenase family protein [Armatimonadota bacterium]